MRVCRGIAAPLADSLAQRLRIPGRRLKGIIPYRNFDDADILQQSIAAARRSGKRCRISIVGSSFLGTELATLLTSSPTRASVEVVLISRDELPLEEVLPLPALKAL